MKYYFRALFEKEDEGGYTVTFPDIDEGVTYGETLNEAVEMAQECIGVCLDARKEFNKEFPTQVYDVVECPKNCFMMMIEFDSLEFNKKYNNRSIRKNVTIPAWLNELAESRNVNFSNVLQNALMEQLDIK